MSSTVVPLSPQPEYIPIDPLWRVYPVAIYQRQTRSVPVRQILNYSQSNNTSLIIHARRFSAALSNVALVDEDYQKSPFWKTFTAEGCHHVCDKNAGYWHFARYISYPSLAVGFETMESLGVFLSNLPKVLISHEETEWYDENLNRICLSLIL